MQDGGEVVGLTIVVRTVDNGYVIDAPDRVERIATSIDGALVILRALLAQQPPRHPIVDGRALQWEGVTISGTIGYR